MARLAVEQVVVLLACLSSKVHLQSIPRGQSMIRERPLACLRFACSSASRQGSQCCVAEGVSALL